jgi:hypothetical protein
VTVAVFGVRIVVQVLTFPAAQRETTVDGLQPTSTYQFRVVVILADGSSVGPSDVATADTLAAGCGPGGKKKKDKCVVM